MGIIDWIYPKICVGCGREGEYICENCRGKLVMPAAVCPECNEPSVAGWVHGRCRKRRGTDRLMVGLPYRGVVQKCLKNVKYKSSWDVIQTLGEIWMKKIDPRRETLGTAVVTSVPMYEVKERARGFNQAELFAKMIATEWGAPYAELLTRGRETKPMWGLDKKQRKENVEGAFQLNHYTNKSINYLIILVDDVWTTGATMRECASVLKRGGVREVWGVALAR